MCHCLRASALLLTLASGGASAQALTLDLGTLEGPNWRASEVKVALAIGGTSRVTIAKMEAMGNSYKQLSLTCKQLLMSGNSVRCKDGLLETPEKLPIAFTYNTVKRSLSLVVVAGGGERWDIELDDKESTLQLQGASMARLARWLPGDLKPNAGRIYGTARITPTEAHADVRVEDGGFTDTAGLHAGEKLAGAIKIDAQRARDGLPWQWKLAASWDKGAVFWSPLYLSNAGHTIVADGDYAGNIVKARHAVATWPHLGKIDCDFTLNLQTKDFESASVKGDQLQLTALRELIPQDWLEKHDLEDLKLAGTADLDLSYVGDDIERFHFRMQGAGLDAAERKLAMQNLSVLVDYVRDKPGPFSLEIAQLRLRGITAGPIKTVGEFRDGRLTIPSLLVPVLDGVFVLNDIAIANPNGDVTAELRGAFTPLAMDKLTAGLELFPLAGTISAVIPHMTYAKSTLQVDGALLFKVFGGDASLDNIRLENPLGRTPRLTADMRLRNMDLEQMTGAIKFGSISGKADVDLIGLQMENWQPLKFDARVLTSPGDFKKRISQRAVQNISSIGGAGAGAAIQASFLRVFSSFGYSKIGLSCKLANGICELGGVENVANGGFAIIEGGGVPAVNLVGYNRRVGWDELLARIKAVIDGNSKMVIQ
ncbi:MAG: hypothetical protein JWN73_2333 [Betaproteobacteria bacterium]|nr:hypothetical protein [Betaproteobacteria bacterium]